MILHRYFAWKFFLTFLTVFGIFFLLLGLVDLVEQLRRARADATFADALRLTLLNIPQSLYRILPLITILSTLALFLGLARTSEMVVTRASGRSALRSLVAPICVALALGGVAIGILNPIVAATSKQYEREANALKGQTSSALSLADGGFWLRQGSETEQTVIRAGQANLEGSLLADVTFLTFSRDGVPIQRLDAARAELLLGFWRLSDVKVWRFDESENPEANSLMVATFEVSTDLTKARIQDSFGTPSAIPIWELPSFIQSLERAGFSALSHKIWLQMELALPLLMVAMVLIGAGFTMRHVRFGRTGQMVLAALLLGFGLFFLRNFAQIMGENGQLPILFAAWGPPAVGVLLPLGLLLHLEDG